MSTDTDTDRPRMNRTKLLLLGAAAAVVLLAMIVAGGEDTAGTEQAPAPTETVTVAVEAPGPEPTPTETVTVTETVVDTVVPSACRTAIDRADRVVAALDEVTEILQASLTSAADGFIAISEGDVAGIMDATEAVEANNRRMAEAGETFEGVIPGYETAASACRADL